MGSTYKASFYLSALAVFLFAVQPRATAQEADGTIVNTASQQLFVLANQTRAQFGAGQLHWDKALAAAALIHCRRMVQEGPLSHQYPGEPDLTERAAQVGAHFSVLEENLAIGPTAAGVHDQWMNSPGHRRNLLSPDVDRVGIAVIASRGVLYAAAEYSRGVESMGPREAEARVAALIRPSGVTIMNDPSVARSVCVMEAGAHLSANPYPGFIMRWQDSQLDQLPGALSSRLSTGQYHRAAVGSCPAQGTQGTFTAYRFAVLLY